MSYKPLTDEEIFALAMPPHTSKEWSEVARLCEQARRANRLAEAVKAHESHPSDPWQEKHRLAKAMCEALRSFYGDEETK